MRLAAPIVGLFGLGVACTPPGQTFTLPPIAPGGSAILASRWPDGHQLYAFEGPLPPLTAPGLEELVLIAYDERLTTYGLSAGPVEEGRDLAPIPILGAKVHQSTVDRGGVGAFRELEVLPDWLAGLRVRARGPLGPLACLEAGGCYRDQAGQQVQDCKLPCEVDPPVVAPPAPVDMRPCPTAWVEVQDGPHLRCAPPPRIAECPRGQAQWIDSLGCAPIGPACPTSGWAEVPGPARKIHVRPGASGGDGGEATPFGTLQEALDASIDGDVILLGPGRLELPTPVRIDRAITLAGTCPAESTVVATGNAFEIASALTLSGVAIEAGTPLVVLGGARLEVRDVELIGGAIGRGISADGPVIAERIKSRGFDSFLVNSLVSGPAELRRIDVGGASGPGMVVWGPTTLEDAWIHDSGASAVEGRALAGSSVVVRRTAVERQVGNGLVFDDAALELEHFLAIDTVPDSIGRGGNGLYLHGGQLLGRALYVTHHQSAGWWMFGATAHLEDVWVEDAQGATAINLQGEADTTPPRPSGGRVRRALLTGVKRGIEVTGGGQYTLEDVTLRGPIAEYGWLAQATPAWPQEGALTRIALTGEMAVGLEAEGPAVTLVDAEIGPGPRIGVFGTEGKVVAERVHVHDLVGDAQQEALGWVLDGHQHLEVQGFLIERTGRAGLSLGGEDYRFWDGIIAGCKFGALIPSARYESISERVLFTGNASTIIVAN